MTTAAKLPSIKYFAIGLIGLAFSCSLFFAAAPRAQAASLTQAQISSIIGLLQAFGADQAVINKVQAALNGVTVTSTVVPSSTTNTTQPTTTTTTPTPTTTTTQTSNPTTTQPSTTSTTNTTSTNNTTSNTTTTTQPSTASVSPSVIIPTLAAATISTMQVSSSSIVVAYTNIPTNINAKITIVAQVSGVVVATYAIPFGRDSAVNITVPVVSITESTYVAKIVGGSFSITSKPFPLSGAAPFCSISVKGTMVIWNSSGAISATSNVYNVNANALTVPTIGSTSVNPSTPTKYSFWFTGPGGITKCVSDAVIPPVIVTDLGTNSVTNTSTAADTPINPTLLATISPADFKNGATLTLKWDVTAPVGYKLEIGIPALLKLRGDLPGDSPLYRSNILRPAVLNATTGTLTGASSDNSFAAIPSHGTLTFTTNYASNILPVVSPVVFTLLNSSGAYITQAVASVQIVDPNIFAGATGGITGATLSQSSTQTPTVYGVAAGTDKVSIKLTNSSGASVFTSSTLSVVNGTWSVVVTGVSAGSYLVHVYDVAHNNTELEAKYSVAVAASAPVAPTPSGTLTVTGCTVPFAGVGCAMMATWSSSHTSGLVDLYITRPDGTRSLWIAGGSVGSQLEASSVVGAYLIQLYDHVAGGTGTPLAQATLQIKAPGTSMRNTPGDYAVFFVQSLSATTIGALALPFTLATDMLGSAFYAAGLF